MIKRSYFLAVFYFLSLAFPVFQASAEVQNTTPLSPEGPPYISFGDIPAPSSQGEKSGWSLGLVQGDGDFIGADAEGNAVVDRNRVDMASSGGKTEVGLNYRHGFSNGVSADLNVSYREDTAVMIRFTKTFDKKSKN